MASIALRQSTANQQLSTRFWTRCAALALAIALTACGGGDPDEHVPTPGVDCQARPDLCK